MIHDNKVGLTDFLFGCNNLSGDLSLFFEIESVEPRYYVIVTNRFENCQVVIQTTGW